MGEKPHDADYILITHDHYDHFSPKDIEKTAGGNTVLIVPEKMQGKANEAADLVSKIITVKPGVCHEIDGLELVNTLRPSVAIPVFLNFIVTVQNHSQNAAAQLPFCSYLALAK